MDAMAERQVLAGGPVDQKTVGVIEAAGIAIGRGHVQRDDCTLGDWCAGENVIQFDNSIISEFDNDFIRSFIICFHLHRMHCQIAKLFFSKTLIQPFIQRTLMTRKLINDIRASVFE